MRRNRREKNRESGAALIVVLLLVATLSFILLSVANVVTASVKRSGADRARTEYFWRAAAGELVARQILDKYVGGTLTKMAPDDEIFAKPIELEIEGGTATILFADATQCFNINSLVKGSSGTYSASQAEADAFVILLNSIGLSEGEARKISDVIVDYIDSDSSSEPQGAEDGLYTALPTPFRTGGQPIESVSELRALDGISRERYLRIKPFICALGAGVPGNVNLNWSRKLSAPVLLALQPTGSNASLSEIESQIGSLPPGGVANLGDLNPPLAGVPQYILTSDRIEAKITLEVNDLTIEEKLLFDTSAAPVRLIARTFGDDY